MNIPVILDLEHRELPEIQPVIIRQGEAWSITLKITINEHGKPYNLTGCKVFFRATRPDYAVVSQSCYIEQATAGTVSTVLSGALSGAKGKISLAYVEVQKNNAVIATTDDIPIIVRGHVDISAAEAKSVVSEIEELKKLLHGVIDQGKAQMANQQAAYLIAEDRRTQDAADAIMVAINKAIENTPEVGNSIDTLGNVVAGLSGTYLILFTTLYAPPTKATVSAATATMTSASVSADKLTLT